MDKIPRILIVDDEPFNVDYLEQELEDLNYQTITAANGKDALEKIGAEKPDLVLLDIMMPIMDGFTVLEKVKADSEIRNIPIIVISANNDLPNMVKGIELGAEDYLPKPFEPTLLKARIQSCLEKKRLRDLQDLYLKSLEKELNIARDIQKEFLPEELPKIEGWEIASYFKAAKEVAGDFYDAFILPDGNLAFVVADVCGKGIGAALYMTLFRSLIRSTANASDSLTPAQRLQHSVSLTNDYVAETHESASMFATIFIGILEPQSGKLFYINGGNESALIAGKDGNVHAELSRTGPAIGITPGAKHQIGEIVLTADDLLIAFTDGIPDTQNTNKEFFGKEKMLEILKSHTTQPGSFINKMEEALQAFIGSADQFDDITLLVVKKM